MDRRRILDKLRKLLALAQSSNPHEASSARQKADSLMARHHITEDDVVEHARSDYHEVSLGDRGWNAPWRFALVTVAARSRGAEAVALQEGRRRKVRICGERGKVEEAHQFYLELLDVIRDLEKLALDEYGDELGGLIVGDSARDITLAFRQGAVIGIAQALDMSSSRASDSTGSRAQGRDETPTTIATDRLQSDLPVTVQVGMVVRGAQAHAEKIREKYAPRERPVIAVGEISETFVFLFGRRLASSRVLVEEDGRVVLRRADENFTRKGSHDASSELRIDT